MDRQLARSNPRAYAVLFAGMDSTAKAEFLRTLSPADAALHLEAVLASLVQPPHPITGGRLEPSVEVRGSAQLGLMANLYVEEPGGERVNSFSVESAHWLKPAEMRGLLQALWSASMSQGLRPSLTTVLYSCSLEEVPPDDRLLLTDVLLEGLKFNHADLSFTGSSSGPDGQQLGGSAFLTLNWEAPDGGEVRALFAHVHGGGDPDSLVAWSRAVTRARGWPRMENLEYVQG